MNALLSHPVATHLKQVSAACDRNDATRSEARMYRGEWDMEVAAFFLHEFSFLALLPVC